MTDGQPLSCFKYPSATIRSLFILFILFSDETNSGQTQSDTGTVPDCSHADNAVSEDSSLYLEQNQQRYMFDPFLFTLGMKELRYAQSCV